MDSSLSSVQVLQLGTIATLSSAQSPRNKTVYVAGLLANGRRQLFAIDPSARRVLWTEALPMTINGVNVTAGDFLGVSNDERWLLIPGSENGVGGIVALDVATRQTARFVGPFAPWASIKTLAHSPGLPDGTIVIASSRTTSNRAASLFFVDPASLSVIDSLSSDSPQLAGDSLEQVIPSVDGTAVYLVGFHTLRRLDLATRAIVTQGRKSSLWGAALTSDGMALVVVDQGFGLDSPGSGSVFVYESATLALRGSIPLPPVAGFSPRVSVAATSGLSPSSVIVTTGTPHLGPLFGPQPSAVIEVDVLLLRSLRSLDLHDWSAVGPYLF